MKQQAQSLAGSRRGAAALAVAVVVGIVGACGGSSLDSTESSSGGGGDGGPVKLGLLVPLSGVYAPLGEDMRDGFQLYLDANDGKLGGREVELVTADEGEGPQTGVPAATRLVTQDQVAAVVGVVNSATAAGVRDLFTESKVPLVVANAGADALTDPVSPYIWRTSFTNGDVSAALGPAVAEAAAGGSVYLLAADYAAGKEMVGGFKEAFVAAGGVVAGETYTPFGTTQDFAPFLTRVSNSGASAVFCFYAGAEAVKFVTQYSEFGLSGRIPLYGTGFLTEGGVLAAQGAAAVGTTTSLHYSDQLDTPENEAFVEDYTTAYGEAPTVYSVQAYDTAAVLDQALATADGSSGDALADALEEVGEIASPRGPWTFDDSHDPVQQYYLRTVTEVDGGFVNVVERPLDD